MAGARGWMWETLTPREVAGRSFTDERGWAGKGDEAAEHSILRLQYGVLVDLYKYYLDVAWKAVVWYYTSIGAVLIYYLPSEAKSGGAGLLRVLLLFVALLGAGFGYVYWRAAKNLFETIGPLEYIARELGLPGRPHLEFACSFLLIQAAMSWLISMAAVLLFAVRVATHDS